MGKIYLVAGHGGIPYDPGAVGNGYKEAELTRRMVKDIAAQLDGKAVIYPIENDLYKTKEYSYFKDADYVLEIHFNSNANASAHGSELLIKQGIQPDNKDKAIYNSISKEFTGRGIKTLSSLANMNQFGRLGIGYALLEVCFISNTKDMNYFQQNYDSIISNIVKALRGVGNNKDVDVSQTDEWRLKDDKWWYHHVDGSYTKNNWEYIHGKWYFFDDQGWMVTGWIKWKDKDYYCGLDGAMLSGIRVKINAGYYAFNEDGHLEHTDKNGGLH